MSAFERDLDRNAANYAPLTPLSFIERAAKVHPQRLAVVHEDKRYTWKQTYERTRRLAWHAPANSRKMCAAPVVEAFRCECPVIWLHGSSRSAS